MENNTIATVSVLGAGLMGHGIAQIFAANGYNVRIHDVDVVALAAVPQRIHDNFQILIRLNLARPENLQPCLNRITLCESLSAALSGADVVVEAVTENLSVKAQVFREVERHVSRAAILCTNTSAISISEIATALQYRERFLGTHFWNPPHVVPCVEVIRGKETSDQVFETIVELMRRVGKEPVRVLKDVPGFLGNRLQHAMWREAIALVAEGIASAEDIDKVVKYGFGLRCAIIGPLETADLAGLDLTFAVHEYLFPHLNADRTPSPFLRELIEQGKRGVKTGQGFHGWTPERATKLIQKRDGVLLQLLDLIRSWGN